MGYFNDISFETTQDGSIGLFDKKIGDIFHSKSGALKEANDKFINPVIKVLSHFSDDIDILDICYGIGYNSKAVLENIKNYNLRIDALEYSKDFIFLSPFINDGINNDDLKLFLLSQIFYSVKENTDIVSILDALSGHEYDKYISPFTRRFIESFLNKGYIINPKDNKSTSLHNIYYQYLSNSMKTYQKPPIYKNSCINFFLGDARKTIFKTTKNYDIVFLDAFSPQKDPTLWTIDFLSAVKSKMKQNSILLSYSKSAPFRSALLELGFYVGKTFIDNIDMGTTASFNPLLVQNKLNNEDLAILQTRSGIPYRDINLNLPSSSIIINRSIEGAVSDRISRTQFIKKLV